MLIVKLMFQAQAIFSTRLLMCFFSAIEVGIVCLSFFGLFLCVFWGLVYMVSSLSAASLKWILNKLQLSALVHRFHFS